MWCAVGAPAGGRGVARVLGLDVRGLGLCGRWVCTESSSWVMVGTSVPVSLASSDATTARGYATIILSGMDTLGAGRPVSMGVNSVVCTLGCATTSATALVSAICFCCGVNAVCTLGVVGGSMACMLTVLLLFAAFVKMCSSRLRACTSSSHMLFGLYWRRACDILFAAEMMASSGVTVGLVMYLCLKKAVSDTLVAFVFMFHRFQHL